MSAHFDRMNGPNKRFQSAVIHIGANSIALLVAQRPDSEHPHVEVLEFLSRPVSLGMDIFHRSRISPETMEACTDALRTFLDTISETLGPGALPDQVYATNILNEASNEDTFLNRVSITCGMEVSALDDGEMTRLIYFITQRLLSKGEGMMLRRTLICHLGPGNTRILYFHNGKIDRYSSYRLGGFRVVGSIRAEPGDKSLLEACRRFDSRNCRWNRRRRPRQCGCICRNRDRDSIDGTQDW